MLTYVHTCQIDAFVVMPNMRAAGSGMAHSLSNHQPCGYSVVVLPECRPLEGLEGWNLVEQLEAVLISYSAVERFVNNDISFVLIHD